MKENLQTGISDIGAWYRIPDSNRIPSMKIPAKTRTDAKKPPASEAETNARND